MRRIALISLLAILTSAAQATTVAIIDSGTDYKHEMLAKSMWMNKAEVADNNRDEDRNGYQDDIYGWNFAEGNNQVIDYSYLGLLNDDVRQFFIVQQKAMIGQATAEEIEWARAKMKDENFIKRISVYGNFMHGTHVAGISVKETTDSKILAVKLLPTEVKLPGQKVASTMNLKRDWRDKALGKALEFLATQQVSIFQEICYYIADHGAEVANGSFGVPYQQAMNIVSIAYRKVLRKDPTAEELQETVNNFIKVLLEQGKIATDDASDTLFVFASGNEGLDNDKFFGYPTNIQADNVISVGASIGHMQIAPFSNYGIETVDVLAPGVGIKSASPGDKYIKISGTSQAAPHVANIAGELKTINPELTPRQMKQIIMETVDVKIELSNFVKTSGIVNKERALNAGRKSLEMDVDRAIMLANDEVEDVAALDHFWEKSLLYGNITDLVLPLPSVFKM